MAISHLPRASSLWRSLFALSLSTTAIVWPAPGRSAALAENVDPDARLEIILKNVHVFDDNDWWFSGEITLNAAVYECKLPPAPECTSPPGSYPSTTMNLTSTYIQAASD